VLAETSDILFSADQSVPELLSLHELVEIKRAIAESNPVHTQHQTTGVYKVRQKWRLYFDMIVWAFFETHDAAVVFREACCFVRDGERKHTLHAYQRKIQTVMLQSN
jgi:hypothetical protein